jgi:flagellar biosynthesis protein FlhF
MKMKTYQADTMQEALSLVKDEMGPDAVILKSRRATRKVGSKMQSCFEITAGQEETLASKTQATPGVYDWKGSLRRVDEEGNPKNTRSPSTQGPVSYPPNSSGSLIELLRSEIREMKDSVNTPAQEMKNLKAEIKAMMESATALTASKAALSKSRNQPESILALSSHIDNQNLKASLLEMEIEPELVDELLHASSLANQGRMANPAFGAPDREALEMENLTKCMADRLRVTGGIHLQQGRPTTVALVGPTGVGKTTTLAKLAALAKMQQGKKVGIISADSFRMGANEQLELFGRTANIPVRPVFSPTDVIQAQREFADRDLILVDTAGRSHTHLEMWRELQSLLRCLHPDEVHLVLSGPTRMRELRHQYGLYRDLGATSLIFTKLDECITLGCLYNLARRAEAPLSYLCNGQIIPDHILLAKPDSLASTILDTVKSGQIAPTGR